MSQSFRGARIHIYTWYAYGDSTESENESGIRDYTVIQQVPTTIAYSLEVLQGPVSNIGAESPGKSDASRSVLFASTGNRIV